MTTIEEMNQNANRMMVVFEEATEKLREVFPEFTWKSGFSLSVMNDENKATEIMDAIEFYHGARPKLHIESFPEATIYQITTDGYIC